MTFIQLFLLSIFPTQLSSFSGKERSFFLKYQVEFLKKILLNATW